MPLINCEVNLIAALSTNRFIIFNPGNNEVPTFAITNTKLYVLVVTASAHNNAKLSQQLKSGFKSTIN